MSIAEQMGVALAKTPRLFGEHQGAGSISPARCSTQRFARPPTRRTCRASRSDGSRGRDIIREKRDGAARQRHVINAPYNGGTISPTSPCCTPAFEGRNILFWVASRGHHADVGGISPGSMSPNATTIEQEGVYIDKFRSSSAARS